MNRRNIVITGLGRNGTTLTCHLLNKLPNTIALSEPIPPRKFEDYMPDLEAVCDLVERYFRRMRRNALRKGFVISKHVGGIVPDNTKGTVDIVLQRIAERVRSAAWTPSRYETTWFVYRPTPVPSQAVPRSLQPPQAARGIGILEPVRFYSHRS